MANNTFKLKSAARWHKIRRALEMSKEDTMLEELKKIRQLLEPKPAPAAPPAPKGMWAEFMDFISEYKVMGLAVAFILGVYLGSSDTGFSYRLNHADNKFSHTEHKLGSNSTRAVPHRSFHRGSNNIHNRSFRDIHAR